VWYPVVGNSSALSTVKGRFCGDAYINASGRTQAASFTSRSQARAFAQRLSSASGHSFWVGDP